MAFTAAQKDKAVGHLGFAVTAWSINFVGSRMDEISGLSSDAETRVVAILTQMDAVETQRNSYLADSGKQLKVDSTAFYPGQAIAELNQQYKYWQCKLATALNLTLPKTNQVVRS